MENDNNKIVISWTNGEIREANCVALFEIKEFGKKFIIYSFDEHDNNGMNVIHVSEVEETADGTANFKEVNIEDWGTIKDFLKNTIKSGEGKNA